MSESGNILTKIYLGRESGEGQQWYVAIEGGVHTCDPEVQPQENQFKYALEIDSQYRISVRRHGEMWRDLTGDKFTYILVASILEQDKMIRAAQSCLVCAAISPLDEVISNTYEILGGYYG